MTAAARVFTAAKTVESRALNLAGVQPFRSVLARLFYKLRRGPHDPMVAELARSGIVVWEDFLPSATFAAVKREAENFMGENAPTWIHHHGRTQVRHYALMTIDPERFPQLAEWRWHPQVMALAGAAERRNPLRVDGGSLIEHLSVSDSADLDEQTLLHVDTFFTSHKIWLYLDDVTVENAAFVYVPGSHLIDRVRLHHDYVESTTTNEPSRRVSDDEVRARGLERRVVTCPRNTLVVANTCGYHCRSVGEAGASRSALHKTFRFNPFRPGGTSRASSDPSYGGSGPGPLR